MQRTIAFGGVFIYFYFFLGFFFGLGARAVSGLSVP